MQHKYLSHPKIIQKFNQVIKKCCLKMAAKGGKDLRGEVDREDSFFVFIGRTMFLRKKITFVSF